jgi:hypothetical protein
MVGKVKQIIILSPSYILPIRNHKRGVIEANLEIWVFQYPNNEGSRKFPSIAWVEENADSIS